MSAPITTLLHHPLLSHYLRFVATTVGRDKVLRTVQYFARFLSFYLLRKGYAKETIQPWAAIKGQFGTVRKAMRLGKNLEHAKAVSVALESKGDPIKSYLTAGRQLGYFGYLTLDNLAFFHLTSIRRFSPETAKKITLNSQKFWFMGLFFSLLNSLYTLRALADEESRVKKTEAEGRLAVERIAKQRKQVKTQLLSDACDVWLPVSSIGWWKLDDGVLGLLGLVSSVIGVRSAWRKSA
ncbi:peroxisomal biogenesis factor 11 [Ascodesmis nigricans]|uniref:Peroxisomal biogenesis factor 11 n=1 Tax=Ascodesmis nigricans TaxID=341454 RepID=A0A4S2MMI8_9PEZI|nr:peroxisomal biogenesis factor 11 [Ascodesmis nigricans]